MDSKQSIEATVSSAGIVTLPVQRVKGIMKTNERVAMVSAEAALVMTKATEHFIGWVTSKAMANKDLRDRKKVSLNYHDLPPLVAQNPDQLQFATDLLPFRRPKWEHLGMQGPTGPKPAFSQSNAKPKNSRPEDVSKLPAKKRSKPKVKVSGDTDMSEEQEGASNLSIVTSGAKPRARKSDGDGGSKKRAKKADGEERPRHGGIHGMLDDDEDSADRRAVENLVEAARGNIEKVSEQPAKVARKKNGSGNRSKGEKAASHEFGGEAGGGAAGVVGGSPQRGGAASFLGSFGMGALQIPGMQQLQQQQQQQMHDFHKRMEQAKLEHDGLSQRDAIQRQLQQRVQQQHQAIVAQTTQRLVAQAVQQAQQRMQQNGGGAPGSQAAQAGAAASALMFPGMPQNGSNGVNMTEQSHQQIGGFNPLQAGLAQLLSMPVFSTPQGGSFNTQLLAMLGAAAAAQAAHANAAAANANSSPNPPNGLGSPQVSGAPAGASAVPKESQ